MVGFGLDGTDDEALPGERPAARRLDAHGDDAAEPERPTISSSASASSGRASIRAAANMSPATPPSGSR